MFPKEILLEQSAAFARCACIVNGQIERFAAQKMPEMLGAIYWGKVVRAMPGMQAVFVDVGLKDPLFLSAKRGENWLPGSTLLVQVSKLTGEEKKPQVTARCRLPGHLICYLPQGTGLAFSRRLPHEARLLFQQLVAENGLPGGWIIRRAAENRLADVQREMEYLYAQWRAIQQHAAQLLAPDTVRSPDPVFWQWVRDEGDGSVIWVADNSTRLSLLEMRKQYPVEVACTVHVAPGGRPFERHGASHAWHTVRKKQLDLPSGGQVTIEYARAMTVMDVNSGRAKGERDPLAYACRINQEAMEAITRHIRLANISGQIWIDGLDMPHLDRSSSQHTRLQEYRLMLEKTMQSGFSGDVSRVAWEWYLTSGLCRVTRQRRDPPVWEAITEPCKHCHGTGCQQVVEWLH